MANQKHVVMKRSLAKALLEAGIQHFDGGGTTQGFGQGSGAVGAISGLLTPQNQYQAQLAPTDYTNFSPYLTAAANNSLSGYGTSQSLLGQQQSLASQLLAQGNGAGPNPAQAALNENTAENIKNQAALAASVRGSNANPGLIARQAAMQGSATQQQAVGQEATLAAEQQLAAQSAAANVLNQAGSQNVAEQGVNNSLYGTSAGAENTQNSNTIQNYNMAQGINSQIAQNNANATNKTSSNLVGGVLGGGSSIMSMFDEGGEVGESATVNVPNLNDANAVASDNWNSSGGGGGSGGGGKSGGGLSSLFSMLNEGGPATNYKLGGNVPGKAKYPGNNPKNDVVPALLSKGEDVLPNSVTQAPDAPERAKKFVEMLQEQQGEKTKGYGKVLKAKATLKDRVERLEKLCSGGMAQ